MNLYGTRAIANTLSIQKSLVGKQLFGSHGDERGRQRRQILRPVGSDVMADVFSPVFLSKKSLPRPNVRSCERLDAVVCMTTWQGVTSEVRHVPSSLADVR